MKVIETDTIQIDNGSDHVYCHSVQLYLFFAVNHAIGLVVCGKPLIKGKDNIVQEDIAILVNIHPEMPMGVSSHCLFVFRQ